MPAPIEALGYVAAPSLRSSLLFISGVALWSLYGLLTGDGPLIVANAITQVSAGLNPAPPTAGGVGGKAMKGKPLILIDTQLIDTQNDGLEQVAVTALLISCATPELKMKNNC